MRVLNISYAERLALDGTSQGLQSAVMPWIGRVIDRRGNVPVLVVSQLLVACGMLFLLVATPEYRWWVAGAYALWIAYAGINVAMPNLVLTLTQRESYAAYAAAWFAWTQLVYALSTLAGGLLFDWASANWQAWSSTFGGVDHFVAIFVLGFVLRLIGGGTSGASAGTERSPARREELTAEMCGKYWKTPLIHPMDGSAIMKVS